MQRMKFNHEFRLRAVRSARERIQSWLLGYASESNTITTIKGAFSGVVFCPTLASILHLMHLPSRDQ